MTPSVLCLKVAQSGFVLFFLNRKHFYIIFKYFLLLPFSRPDAWISAWVIPKGGISFCYFVFFFFINRTGWGIQGKLFKYYFHGCLVDWENTQLLYSYLWVSPSGNVARIPTTMLSVCMQRYFFPLYLIPRLHHTIKRSKPKQTKANRFNCLD